MDSNPEEEGNVSVLKYELMLKGNTVVFFDSFEFEDIVVYYLERGEYQKARRALQTGLEQHPGSFELKLLEVEILIIDFKFDKATAILDQLSEIEPHNTEIFVQKANLLSRQGRFRQAIDMLQQAEIHTDDIARIHYLLAMQYLHLEQYVSAKEYFKKCLLQEPENTLFLQQLMFCYEFLEVAQPDEAIDFLERYLQDYPYNEVGWLCLGRCYLNVKNYEKALSCFDYAIISDVTFSGSYFEKAKLLEQMKEYDEAIVHYEMTLQLEDPTPYAYLRIGKCYEKKGDFDGAEQLYRKAIYEDPQFDEAWFELSKLSWRKQDFDQAKKSVEKALMLDSLNLSYRRHQIRIYEKLQDTSSWIKAIEAACEISGDQLLSCWLQELKQAWEVCSYEKISVMVQQIKKRLSLL